jgi:predicted RNase H-like HicB family nuclease
LIDPVLVCLDADLVADATRVHFEGRFLACIRKADVANVFVSHVPLLDVYSQGRTEQEAIRAIESAVRLYVVAAYRRGSLGCIMQRHPFGPARHVEGSSGQEYMRVRDAEEFPAIADMPATVNVGAL